MRKLLLSAAAITLLFSACKKDGDNSTGLGNNQWKIGGTTYNALVVSGAAGWLVASANNGVNDVSTFSVYFDNNVLPTSGGTFKIVDAANDPNEVAIMVGKNDGTNSYAWGSTATGNPDATVSIEGGKVKVSVPELTLTSATSASTTFSGNITQQ